MPDSNATITRNELIARAFRRIGIDSPSTNETALAASLLNDVVREIDAEGRWLWTVSNTPSELTLVASQQAYTVGTGASNIAAYIMALERMEIVQGTSLIPLRVLDKTESITTWEREATTGEPYLVYLERAPLNSSNRILFYPTPDSAYEIQYYYRRRLYDFDAAGDNPDFPQEWNQKLVRRLSYELSPEYGIPLAERQLLLAEAQEAMRMGKAANADKAHPVNVNACYF